MKKYQRFLSENFQFLEVKFSIYLNRRVFVMGLFVQKPTVNTVDAIIRKRRAKISICIDAV